MARRHMKNACVLATCNALLPTQASYFVLRLNMKDKCSLEKCKNMPLQSLKCVYLSTLSAALSVKSDITISSCSTEALQQL